MSRIQVDLGNRSYVIHAGSGLLRRAGKLIRDLGLGRRCVIVADSNTAPRFSEPVRTALALSGIDSSTFIIPAGERSKSSRQLIRGYDFLARQRLERDSFLVALGGGVVGDLGGFLAATYLRGIPFVQIPTTLLAQVDSSVGGKVGINLPSGKNLVGAFYQPRAVLCDLDSLATLAEREFRAGLAEVIKYGIIYDADFFYQLERRLPRILSRQPKALEAVIARCCEIKAEVVSQDESEGGLRAILNFGHTIGHAIEAVAGYGKYLHGEAISIGQIAAARLSRDLAGLSQAEVSRVESLLARTGLPTRIQLSGARRKRLFQAMRLDKKVRDGEIRFVLAERIGKVRWSCPVPLEQIHAVLDSLS